MFLMDRQEVKHTNKEIEYLFGRDQVGRPHFRVVWSNDQFETAYREREIYYGLIFLRTEWGVKTIPKYNYLEDRWILERLFNNSPAITGIQSNFTYEPLFVFQDGKGNYLEPVFRAVYLIIQHALYGPPRKRITESDMKSLEEKELAEDIEFINTYLENESPYIATVLHNREAVVRP